MSDRPIFYRRTIASVVLGTAAAFSGGSVLLSECTDTGAQSVRLEHIGNKAGSNLASVVDNHCHTVYFDPVKEFIYVAEDLKSGERTYIELHDFKPGEKPYARVCSTILDVVDIQPE